MSQPDEVERHLLDRIADTLREAFSERGYRVDAALALDPSFGSGNSRSWLMRDLVIGAISRTASQLGVYFQPVNGSGRELIGARHRYRIRRARRNSFGNVVITVSTESTLGADEPPTLFPMENWIFGWIADAEGLIAEVIAAEVRGVVPGTPGKLTLGEIITLGSGDPFGGGFKPRNESLGNEDLDLDEGEEGIGA
jgi:hypothetical protein